MRAFPVGLAIAAASGGAWALCFGREPSAWLGWVALAPFVAVLGEPRLTARRAAVLGWVQGFVAWVPMVWWIAPTIGNFGRIPAALAWSLMGLVCFVLALFHAVFAAVGRRLARRGDGLALAALPALWVVLEWLRGNALGTLSFPWNLAAYAWVEVPGALPLAAWVGAWGVSYAVVAVNVALGLAWRRRRPALAAGAVLTVLLALAFAARFSRPAGAEPSVGGGRQVRIVQPNATLQPEDGAVVRRQYHDLIRQSEAECRGEPALLIWPESAAWPAAWGSWDLRRDVARLASRGCTVVLNSPTLDAENPADDVYYNSALLIPAGPAAAETVEAAGRYDKRHLVPWGEHVPLADLLPFVDTLARFAGRFTAGTSPALLEWDGERLGMAICYEVIFPAASAAQARAGATVLVNVSNDAWYGDTSAPRQLLSAARFRAAENRRVMLRAALTGISAVIGRRGEVRERLDLGARGVLRRRVRGTAEVTPYARAPWIVPLASGILALAALIAARRIDDHDRDRHQREIRPAQQQDREPPGVSLSARTWSWSSPSWTVRCRRPASGTAPGKAPRCCANAGAWSAASKP